MEKEPIKSHEDLEVYQMAFNAAMKIFELSKQFPVEERYSLTDQTKQGCRGQGARGKIKNSKIVVPLPGAIWSQAPEFIRGTAPFLPIALTLPLHSWMGSSPLLPTPCPSASSLTKFVGRHVLFVLI